MDRKAILKCIFLLCAAVFFLFASNIKMSASETIFTHLGRASKADTRQIYHIELLRLALDKTVKKYGPYKLVSAPVMNAARSMATVRDNIYPNYFANESVNAQRLDEFGYVPFPILRGIVGYRVFFVSSRAKGRLKEVMTLEELKRFTVGQGIGWLSKDILEHNGFHVIVGSSYEGLFRMLGAGRFDLFARGIGEVIGEYEAFKGVFDLDLDDSIAIYYPLPRYFFTHKSNKEAINRVTEGLIAAYEDGSFIDLWKKHHFDSISRVGLSKRKIFSLENPFIKGIDKSYQKYMYKP